MMNFLTALINYLSKKLVLSISSDHKKLQFNSLANSFNNISLSLKNARRNYHGFTMVEILIAITIIAVISAIVVPGLRNFNRNQELETAKATLYNELRQAQSKANASIVCPNVTPTVISLDISWSVILQTDGFTIQPTCIDSSTSQVQTHTSSEARTFPTTTAIRMSENSCGAAADNTEIKFIARNCPVSGATCRTFEITCGDGNPYVFASNNPFIITLTNGENVERSIRISEGGAIYEN